MDSKLIIRPHIQSLTSYSSARDDFHGVAKIFLDANESPYDTDFNRYPDPHQRKLKSLLSKYNNIPIEQIFLGNGSDEAIDLLLRLICEPGTDEVIVPTPTYGMYEVSARVNNIKVTSVPLTDTFDIDLDRIFESINSKTKIIFLCSPNNPTGNLFSFKKIENILSKFNGLVVVDEAYIHFAAAKSLLSSLSRYNNLAILQTFSKAFGMAGLRIGVAYSQTSIIEGLNRIKPPYNINSYSQEQAIYALKSNTLNNNIQSIINEREKLMSRLLKIHLVEKIYPSDSNFLLVKVINSKVVYDELISQKIVVRDRSSMQGCSGCLRITIGTADENNFLIEVLSKL